MSNNVIKLPEQELNETGPYALIGFGRAKLGMADALETMLLSLVEPTLKEDGVLQYNVHRDRTDFDMFVFYEVWASKNHLEKHLTQPYIQNFLSKRMEYFEKDMDIKWLNMRSPFKTLNK